MINIFDLDSMDPSAFEHMVNALALNVLGSGHTGFGPGADGGRDGYFEGSAPYPSITNRWSGTWYIQSKFHTPHLSNNHHQWLLNQISSELELFSKPNSRRQWPDVWILATNIDPSGVPETGVFDAAKKLVASANQKLSTKFHIWGGNKIIDLLDQNKPVSDRYRHFLTPGHVLSALQEQLHDASADIDAIIRYFVVDQLMQQRHAKLDQAGSDADNRPGIHKLFVDLPFIAPGLPNREKVIEEFNKASNQSHRPNLDKTFMANWRQWSLHPSRARIWFIKGGPGQGKSTVTQFFSQVHRAALVQQSKNWLVSNSVKEVAREIENTAKQLGCWPISPRVPIYIELREYARWISRRNTDETTAIIAYIAHRVYANIGESVKVGTIRRALRYQAWLIVFDGLDEVPEDAKAQISNEITRFVDEVLVDANSDAIIACTSRPQGYSGQYDQMEVASITLDSLTADEAFDCACPVIALDRTADQTAEAIANLKAAIDDRSIIDLMTTPLQAHIMAVVVRDGGRPPDRRWKLFENFYQVINKREANRNLPDSKLAKLLREEDKLIRTLHSRLGFILHSGAEKNKGTQIQLTQSDFRELIRTTVREMKGDDAEETANTLELATRQRLVLINTPDDGSFVRFDIRPLQEFFASEFIYGSIDADELRIRLEIISGDQHWREVMHFLLSALIERDKRTELIVAINVLEGVDEGRYEYSRNICRRMSRGSALTMRLVREGVLDQDIQVRAQFKNLVKMIAANPSIDAYKLSVDIKKQTTRSWVINCLIEAINELNSTESLGAVIILLHIVRDNDPQIKEILRILLDMPLYYLESAISARSETIRNNDDLSVYFEDENSDVIENSDNKTRMQSWVIGFAAQLITSNNWDQLGIKGISSARDIIFAEGWRIAEAVAKTVGYNDHEIYLLKVIHQANIYNENIQHYFNIGKIRFGSYENDWSNKKPTQETPQQNIFQNGDARGYLKPVSDMLNFRITHEPKYLKSFYSNIKSPNDNLNHLILPNELQALIPGDACLPPEFLKKELGSMTEREISVSISQKKIKNHFITKPYQTMSIETITNPRTWLKLLSAYPNTVFRHWGTYSGIDKNELNNVFSNQFNFDATIEAVKKLAIELYAVPLIWGFFLSKTSDNSQNILNSLKEIALEEEPNPNIYYGISRPYKLTLPNDAELIPAIISALMCQFNSGVAKVFTGKSMGPDWLQSTLEQIAPDISDLISVTQSHKNIMVKSSAIMMLMINTKITKLPDEWEKIILDSYSQSSGNWFLPTIVKCIKIREQIDQTKSIELVSSLINLSRGKVDTNEPIQEILSRWREGSTAPVTSGSFNLVWLAPKHNV